MAQGEGSCEDLTSRISKTDLYACLSLWMEESPLATGSQSLHESDEPSSHIHREHGPDRKNVPETPSPATSRRDTEATLNNNKVGVVIVDSAEKIVSVECTREHIHGVANALIGSQGGLNNSVIYVSRKPCCFCTKLMVSAGVSRVFFLPFEPECPDPVDLDRAEKLFKTCPIGQSIYLPSIRKSNSPNSSLKRSPYKTSNSNRAFTEALLERYWNENWRKNIISGLKCPEYEDFQVQINERITVMLNWISEMTFGDLPENVTFHADRDNIARPSREIDELPTDSEPSDEWQSLARHLSRMAQILSQRSDDPKRGVGAVILKENQIVAVGWNGYPPKVQLVDFPRACHSDGLPEEKLKYPFSIHAEQSAILTRNTPRIDHRSTTIFVSKKPCDECVPLLLKAGIRNAVYPRAAPRKTIPYLTYSLISRCIREGKLRGFESTQSSGNSDEEGDS